MKLHQNMEKIHSGSATKLWGNWKQRGMLLFVFTLPTCTNLPHHSLHKSSVGGNVWGTSRAQRTFCSLSAPCASHPNVLSYLARVSYISPCQQQVFTGFLWYPPSRLGSSMCPHSLSLVAITNHFPRWQMVLLSAAKAQNMQPCLRSAQCSLSWSMVKNEAGSSVFTAQLQEMFHCVNNTSTKPLAFL